MTGDDKFDQGAVAAGAAVYSPWLLRSYDIFVHAISTRLIFRCSPNRLQALYHQHAGARHLDVGVGTGKFLDGARWPVPQPQITLADLNQNSLAYAARRIARYAPKTMTANVLEGVDLPPASLDSVAVMHLLHCVPGSLDGVKGAAFAKLAPLLADGGALFGSTICGSGVRHTPWSRGLCGVYYRKGVFHCQDDSPAGLEAALRRAFEDVKVEVHGVVALFVARKPLSAS